MISRQTHASHLTFSHPFSIMCVGVLNWVVYYIKSPFPAFSAPIGDPHAAFSPLCDRSSPAYSFPRSALLCRWPSFVFV